MYDTRVRTLTCAHSRTPAQRTPGNEAVWRSARRPVPGERQVLGVGLVEALATVIMIVLIMMSRLMVTVNTYMYIYI